MKQLSKLPVLTALCAALGLICLCVRQWLLRSGTDEKSLLVPGHVGTLLSILLLAAALCVVFLALRQQQVYCFRNCATSIVSMVFFAIGYGTTAWKLIAHPSQTLSVITGILGILSALCTLCIAFALYRKSKLHPFVYCPPAVFLMFFLVCRYQQWSSEPELQRYLFQLLSVVSLMVSAYHRAALEADKKGARSYLLVSRAALFFCIAAIPGSIYGILYGCCAVAIILDGFTVSKKQGA